MVKLFRKNFNLCDHNPSLTSQTDGQTTCDRKPALCFALCASLGKKCDASTNQSNKFDALSRRRRGLPRTKFEVSSTFGAIDTAMVDLTLNRLERSLNKGQDHSFWYQSISYIRLSIVSFAM